MHRPFKLAATTLAVLLALPACAQSRTPERGRAANDADPALWVVKDADTTIYLFGTVHVLKPGLSWFDEAVRAAFDRSDTLVIEMVQPEPAAAQPVVIARGMAPAGPPLSEQLPAGKRAAFAKAVGEVGVPMATVDRMRPWLAAITLSQTPLGKLGYTGENGPEAVLTAAAKASAKPVVGLETFEQQIGFFGGLSQGAQLSFLSSTIDELPRLGQTMAEMVADWSRGDPQKLAALLNDSLKESPEVARVLLTDRNKAWAGWIARRMQQPGTVFVAVGAGHLAGDRSVQAQLAPYRLKAVRVVY